VADYWSRIRDQEGVYDTVTAEEGPFIKVMNVGERIEVNRIEGMSYSRDSADRSGYLQSRCCFFLMNIHTRPRTIYFARVGLSTQSKTLLMSRSLANRLLSIPTKRIQICHLQDGNTQSVSKRLLSQDARRFGRSDVPLERL
jgi:hypothetical protein